jgi:hypothetical protein
MCSAEIRTAVLQALMLNVLKTLPRWYSTVLGATIERGHRK